MGKIFDKITENWTSEDYEKAGKVLDTVMYGTVLVGGTAIAYLLGRNVGVAQGIDKGFEIGVLAGRSEIIERILPAVKETV